MAFRTLFLAHAPDADRGKHKNIIDTGKYKLFTVVVKSQDEAIQTCKDFARKENIDSIILCPGFTHNNVAEIVQATGSKVAVCVARGDGPSNKISQAALKKEGYTLTQPTTTDKQNT